jgi:DNA repair photolyase
MRTVKDDSYRTPNLMVRDRQTHKLCFIENEFLALQSLPIFMNEWISLAIQNHDRDKLLIATINVTDGCPIGQNAFCGHYCFAHKSWDGNEIRLTTPSDYIRDAHRLKQLGLGVSIFLSTDTEPVPGRNEISDVTYELLKAMIKHPPDGLLIHSHTDVLGDQNFLDLFRDLNQATNLIVGIGFDTDTDEIPEHLHGHFTPVQDRIRAFERMVGSGIKTQASITPLIGFRDFEGFGKLFVEMGAYRIMVGELRKKFSIGGSHNALNLELELPVPSESEALSFFQELDLPGGVGLRETFYVLLP